MLSEKGGTMLQEVALRMAAAGGVVMLLAGTAWAAAPPQTDLVLSAGPPICAKDGATVEVSWTEVPATSSYSLYRDDAKVFTGDGSTRKYTAGGLHPGPAYSFRLTAFFTTGRGVSSNVVGVTISPDLCESPPPGPFQLSVGAVGYDSVSTISGGTALTVALAWTGSDWADAFDLYRDGELLVSGLREPSFRDRKDIQHGRSYTYLVRARNTKGIRDSNPVTVQVPRPPHSP
jgi:hypothetical protein